MAYSVTPIIEEDRKPVVDIFNHYVENSFAAYPEEKIPYSAFDMMLKMSGNLPAAAIRSGMGGLCGFGMLRAHNPMPAFSHTAELSCFLRPEDTGKGLGSLLLAFLETEGRKKGVATLLANISSRNPGSVRFHEKNGFVECGRFSGIGKKRGVLFDVLWMQKKL